MRVVKAEFQDMAGTYTMTWSFDPELWQVKDIIQNECKTNNSKLLNILSNEITIRNSSKSKSTQRAI